MPKTFNPALLVKSPEQIVEDQKPKDEVVETIVEEPATQVEQSVTTDDCPIPTEPTPAPTVEVAPTTIARGKYSTEDRIVVLVANPKRPGTAGWERYARYVSGMKVSDYLTDRRNGKFGRADINWDLTRNFIKILPEAEYQAMMADEAAAKALADGVTLDETGTLEVGDE